MQETALITVAALALHSRDACANMRQNRLTANKGTIYSVLCRQLLFLSHYLPCFIRLVHKMVLRHLQERLANATWGFYFFL